MHINNKLMRRLFTLKSHVVGLVTEINILIFFFQKFVRTVCNVGGFDLRCCEDVCKIWPA